MNFNKHMRLEAWLLDNDVLLFGKVKRKGFRRIFVPTNKECGFDYQYVRRKDIGKIIFYDAIHITYAGLSRLERVY